MTARKEAQGGRSGSSPRYREERLKVGLTLCVSSKIGWFGRESIVQEAQRGGVPSCLGGVSEAHHRPEQGFKLIRVASIPALQFLAPAACGVKQSPLSWLDLKLVWPCSITLTLRTATPFLTLRTDAGPQSLTLLAVSGVLANCSPMQRLEPHGTGSSVHLGVVSGHVTASPATTV